MISWANNPPNKVFTAVKMDDDIHALFAAQLASWRQFLSIEFMMLCDKRRKLRIAAKVILLRQLHWELLLSFSFPKYWKRCMIFLGLFRLYLKLQSIPKNSLWDIFGRIPLPYDWIKAKYLLLRFVTLEAAFAKLVLLKNEILLLSWSSLSWSNLKI